MAAKASSIEVMVKMVVKNFMVVIWRVLSVWRARKRGKRNMTMDQRREDEEESIAGAALYAFDGARRYRCR